MDADPTWSFDRYQAYEDVRFRQSLAEQEQALSGGLVADPKSEPHGGYRVACIWPEEVTASACALSARLAELLPETPEYPYQALHSSVGNIAAPGARLVDPDRIPEDRKLLVGLCHVGAGGRPVRRSHRGAGRLHTGQAPAQQASRTCSSPSSCHRVRPTPPVLGVAAVPG